MVYAHLCSVDIKAEADIISGINSIVCLRESKRLIGYKDECTDIEWNWTLPQDAKSRAKEYLHYSKCRLAMIWGGGIRFSRAYRISVLK